MPGSIPAAPTFGKAKENTLPGIDCPDPSQYLTGASKGDIPKKRRAKKKTSTSRTREKGRITEDRDRADRLQAALILARRRTVDPFNDDSPFDIGERQLPFAPNNNQFLQVVDDARLR